MFSKLYTYYCFTIGVVIYLCLFPLQFLFLQFKSTYVLADRVNHWVVRISVALWFFKVDIKRREYLKKDKNYVFVANHTSYLDIPLFFIINNAFGKFVGKSSLQKIPLFGYMYKKLYILVNRRDTESRNQVFIQSKKALEENRNIIIFPEGTFPNKKLPNMIDFKDGAFKIAIETQTPIVPVSILNNWKILSEEKPLRIKKHIFAAIVHKPIDTKGLSLDDLKELKSKVYNIIDNDISKTV